MKRVCSEKLIVSLLCVALAVIVAFSAGCGGGGSSGGGGNGGGDPAQPEILKTAAGVAKGAAVSQTIGAAGGNLSSGDSTVAITVPAGAVDEDIEFSITPVTDPTTAAVATFDLQPEGRTFASPVTITFRAPDEAGVTRTSIEVWESPIVTRMASGSDSTLSAMLKPRH